MSILAFGFSFNSYGLISLIGGVLYFPVFVLNENRNYKIASHYFITLSSCIVIALSIVSILSGNDTNVEYVLFTVLCVYSLLFDGKLKNYLYWINFIALFALKVFHIEWNDLPYDYTFVLTILNLSFIACLLFFFLRFFKRLLFQAVKQSNLHEKTLYALLDNVPIDMAMVGKDGVYKIANRSYSKQFGLEKDDIIGKKRTKILPKEIFLKQEPYFQQALEGNVVSFMEPLSMPNGKVIQARGKFFPIKNDRNQVESVTIYVDDISELKEVEISLKRANETKDKLFSIIAHDVKSPINLFQTLLNVSQEKDLSPEYFDKYKEVVKTKLEILSERLDELLNWARMQMGGINAYPSDVEINTIVTENLALFDDLIEKKNIHFEVDLKGDDLGWIDENHLRIAVRNLIHNAIKFSKSDSKVVINVQPDEDSILIEISDSGAGMSQEMIDSILKKELQKSQEGTSGEMGNGLGLSLSIGLLEKNSCILSIDSKLRNGTTFRIWVPKSNPEG